MLAGGEQQRFGFARALIHRPTILLLDEPVSTLEEAEARDLYGLLAEKLPATIVISSGRSGALAGLHHRTLQMTGCRLPAAPDRCSRRFRREKRANSEWRIANGERAVSAPIRYSLFAPRGDACRR